MSDVPDLGALLAQAQKMQEQLMAAQAEAAEQRLVGSAGGNKVQITATGSGEFVSVHIDQSVVDPGDTESLEDLILAALHDVSTKVAQLSQSTMSASLGGLGGLGGGLGGLLGQ